MGWNRVLIHRRRIDFSLMSSLYNSFIWRTSTERINCFIWRVGFRLSSAAKVAPACCCRSGKVHKRKIRCFYFCWPLFSALLPSHPNRPAGYKKEKQGKTDMDEWILNYQPYMIDKVRQSACSNTSLVIIDRAVNERLSLVSLSDLILHQ